MKEVGALRADPTAYTVRRRLPWWRRSWSADWPPHAATYGEHDAHATGTVPCEAPRRVGLPSDVGQLPLKGVDP